MRKYFYLLTGIILSLFTTACTWQGGDRSLYPLPGLETEKYVALAGVWEGKAEKDINFCATLNYNKNKNNFQLDLIILPYDTKKKMIVAPMTGTFSEISGETYFCATLDIEQLQKSLDKIYAPDEYAIFPLICPVSYIMKISAKDNTISVTPLFYANRTKEEKFESKASESINFDIKMMLLLNSPDQLVDIVRKKEYIVKTSILLTRKTLITPSPETAKQP